MTIWRIRFACWIPTATITNSKYVTIITLPRQKWLHTRASALRYMFVAHFTCPTCLSRDPSRNLFLIQTGSKMNQIWELQRCNAYRSCKPSIISKTVWTSQSRPSTASLCSWPLFDCLEYCQRPNWMPPKLSSHFPLKITVPVIHKLVYVANNKHPFFHSKTNRLLSVQHNCLSLLRHILAMLTRRCYWCRHQKPPEMRFKAELQAKKKYDCLAWIYKCFISNVTLPRPFSKQKQLPLAYSHIQTAE
jgi:hypothetical protein